MTSIESGSRASEDQCRRKFFHKLGIVPGQTSFRPPPPRRREAPDRLENHQFRAVSSVRPPAGSRPPFPRPSQATSVDVGGSNAELEGQASGGEDGEKKEGDCSFEMNMNMLDLRAQDDFRVNYLKTLSYRNVWVPNARKAPRHQTVIIFDWDDTLLCTSFLTMRGENVLSTIKKQMQAIEQTGIRLLTLAHRLAEGRVFIITNAMKGWVQHSSKKYMPKLAQVLGSVTVISARGQFEERYPGQYHAWKVQAFLEVRRELNSQIITNLISVGDSNIEMDAVHVMGKEFAQALVKTIKFREGPSPDELAKQLELVAQKFEKICMNARNLKIGLERKWVHPAPSRQTAGGSDGAFDSTTAPAAASPATSAHGNLDIHRQFARSQSTTDSSGPKETMADGRAR